MLSKTSDKTGYFDRYLSFLYLFYCRISVVYGFLINDILALAVAATNCIQAIVLKVFCSLIDFKGRFHHNLLAIESYRSV